MQTAMSEPPVLVETHGPVTLWRLNQPETRNALSAEIKAELIQQSRQFVDDPGARVLVITGAGDCFCAGGDLRSLDADRGPLAVRARMRLSYEWLRRLAGCEKPVIAAVNGAAVGAGVSLALGTDIVLASDQAWFRAGFPAVGVLPDLGVIYNLSRAIGMVHAKDFLMTNRRIDATTALAMGMVSRVLPHEALLDGALEIANELASGPGVSIGLTKSLLSQSGNDTFETFLSREEAAQAVVFGTDDFAEGSRAFRERRLPRFTGK